MATDPKATNKTDEQLGVKTSNPPAVHTSKVKEAMDDLERMMGQVTGLGPNERALIDNRIATLRTAIDEHLIV